jgi:PLD-like domain
VATVITIRAVQGPVESTAHFVALSDSADEIRLATAWASDGTRAAEALWRNRTKIRDLTVGVDYFATDPAFIRRFKGYVRIAAPPSRALFHPKVYLFLRRRGFDALIGSSNLTRGGFESNIEVNVVVSGKRVDPLFQDLIDTLTALSNGGFRPTKPWLRDYSKRWRQARAGRRATGIPPVGQRPAPPKPRPGHPATLQVGWDEFAKLVLKRSEVHDIFPSGRSLGYLGVVREIQRMLAGNPKFSAIPTLSRERLTGLTRGDEFGYFGTTFRVGHFAHVVKSEARRLDRPFASIPPWPAPITRRHFSNFVRRMPKGPGFGRAGVGSRLLAMKRPDSFLVVNGRNIPQLAAEFGLATSSLHTYEGYWSLLERIWACPWYSTSPPHGRMRKLWEARVAIVDALFYEE